MEHTILHNAPFLDFSSIILFWKKSRKIKLIIIIKLIIM